MTGEMHLWIDFNNDSHDCKANNNYTNNPNFFNPTGQQILNTKYFPDCDWPAEACEIIAAAGITKAYQDIKKGIEIQK